MNPLLHGIVRAAECVTNEMLSISWRETEYRLDMCRTLTVPILRSREFHCL